MPCRPTCFCYIDAGFKGLCDFRIAHDAIYAAAYCLVFGLALDDVLLKHIFVTDDDYAS